MFSLSTVQTLHAELTYFLDFDTEGTNPSVLTTSRTERHPREHRAKAPGHLTAADLLTSVADPPINAQQCFNAVTTTNNN